ncbi:MAG: hypothetical protein GX591_08165 [Planctomycetes bacterium]|nr:hypothetical protein [Planctomycetota bacterium]
MTATDDLRAMEPLARRLLDGLLGYIEPRLAWNGDRAWLPYGSLPPLPRLPVSADTPPSSRLTCDVAMGFVADGRADIAAALLRHAFDRQGADGRFVWNYGQWETDQVDLGTVLDTYGWALALGDALPADVRDGIVRSTRRAIAFLDTMEQPHYPGIIQKRAADPDHPDARRSADYRTIDILNGNALAVTAYCRAAAILDEPRLVEQAARYEKNLLERFGAHVEGWWAYNEKLDDRSMLAAESILYQAMTALYLEPLWRCRPGAALAAVLRGAMAALAGVTDADGRLDWSRETRKDFVGTQLLMLPSAAAALADVADATGAGLRRLRFVADRLADPAAGLLLNEDGTVADELRQIWAVSDLALILLNSRP